MACLDFRNAFDSIKFRLAVASWDGGESAAPTVRGFGGGMTIGTAWPFEGKGGAL